MISVKRLVSSAVAFLLLGQACPAEARHQAAALQTRHVKSHHVLQRSRKYSKRRHVAARPQQQIGVIAVTESGEVILDELSNNEFNPASVAKLVTAFGAIKTLGLNHHFSTRVFTDGTIQAETGLLRGNLYIQGDDPDFEFADADSVKQALLDSGIKKIAGKLIVSPGFSYGSIPSNDWSAQRLKRIFMYFAPRVSVGGIALGQPPENADLLYEHQSESLRDTLKDMLSYSKNNVAEQIARVSGGIVRLEGIVSKEAGLTPGALKLASASGLGKNRVKPKDMILVLKSLRNELQKSGLDLQDICPVAGVDPGTLDERFTDPSERGSVVAKTGTLPGTDGGASALAGMFRTQREDVYFAIFCWRGNVVNFRKQQDDLIRKLQNARGGPRAFQVNTPDGV